MIWFYGISIIIIQTILLREISVLFLSNEIIISFIFFSWLFASGLGSSFFRYFPHKIKTSKLLMPNALFFSNIVFFISVFAIRASYSLFQYQAEPNFAFLSILTFIFIFPVAFLVGLLFTAFASSGKKKVSQVYYIESIAAVLGGILFTYAIAGKVDSLIVAIFLIIISQIFIIVYSFKHKLYKITILYSAIIMISFFAAANGTYVVNLSRNIQWNSNLKLIFSFDSKHGNISIVENDGLKSLYYNGKPISHHPATTLYEERSHLPALVHGNPKRILLLGFSARGLIDELLKYDTDRIVNVELDEKLIKILEKDFNKNDNNSAKKQSIEFYNKDPFIWLNKSNAIFDLVIINIGLPVTIADNRFYSVSFYKSISKALGDNGILAIRVPYEENKELPHTLAMLKIIDNTLGETFQSVIKIPASWFYFLASKKKIKFVENQFIERLKSQHTGSLKFINKGYADHYLNKKRRYKWNELLNNINDASTNDLFNLKIYNSYLLKRIKINLSHSWFILALIVIGLFIIFVKRFRRVKDIFMGTKNSFLLFALGFAGIVGEILLLNFYQSASGIVYNLYALLISFFMFGLGTGSGLVYYNKTAPFIKYIKWLYPMWLISIGLMYTIRADLLISSFIMVNLAVFIWIFLGGFLMGAIFNSMALADEEESKLSANISAELYSFDLMGSAIGALIGGAVLIPTIGSLATALGVSAMLTFVIISTGKK